MLNGDDGRREEMAVCIMSAQGYYAEDEDGMNPVYNFYTCSGNGYNVMEVDRQIYRRAWQSGWLCGKDVLVTGSVQMAGEDQPLVNYSIEPNLHNCIYAGF